MSTIVAAAAVLLLCQGCDNVEPVIDVAIEMPVSELNRQAEEVQSTKDMRMDTSDLWAMGPPHRLVVRFPHGNVEFHPGNGFSGTIIASDNMGPDLNYLKEPVITSISITATRSKLRAEDAVALAKTKCGEISSAMGQEEPDFSHTLTEEVLGLKPVDGVAVCRIVDKDIDTVLSISRVGSSKISEETLENFIVMVAIHRTSDPKYNPINKIENIEKKFREDMRKE